MAATKTCKYCGVEGFIWKRLGPDRWALFEADAQGRPFKNHTAECRQRPGATGNPGSGSASDVADVEATLSEQAEAIDEFIEAANAQLTAEREAAADAADRPALVTYEPRIVAHDPSDFDVPALDPAYIVDTAQIAAVMRVIRLANETGQPQNIGLHGPAGSGKTNFGVQIGALRQSPTLVVDSTDKETAGDWFGTQELHDGTLTFVPSDFVKIIETPNAVCVLDDVALIQARQIQNGLNAVLDPSRRAIYVPQLKREVRVAPGVIFVGTWNVGAEYTGASELSLQILDRFRSGALFEVPYPDDGVLAAIIRQRSAVNKADAARLADAALWLRNDPDPIFCSTRGLIAAGQHVRQGATLGAAMFYTVFGELDAETMKRAYGIIDVNLSRAGYADTDRPRWAAPQTGTFTSIVAAARTEADAQSQQPMKGV